jgi:hypothetical protein
MLLGEWTFQEFFSFIEFEQVVGIDQGQAMHELYLVGIIFGHLLEAFLICAMSVFVLVDALQKFGMAKVVATNSRFLADDDLDRTVVILNGYSCTATEEQGECAADRDQKSG